MFNFPAWKAVVFPVVSRMLMNEEVPISDERLKKISDELDEFSEFSENLDISNPLTWGGGLSYLLDRKINNHKKDQYDSIADHFKIKYNKSTRYHAVTDRDIFYAINENIVENALKYYSEKVNKVKIREQSDADTVEIANGLIGHRATAGYHYYIAEGYNFSEYSEILQILFWSDSNCKLLGYGNNSSNITNIDLSEQKYYGPLHSKKEKIKKMYDREGKWTLLLQGKPGVGKTTFCYELAADLSDRILILSPEYFENVSSNSWSVIQECISPDIVIFNDIDRLNFLENKLSLLEDRSSENINLIFMTTNHVENMDEAVKRPGRVDHIIEMETPRREVREFILGKFAEEVGIDQIPDKYIDNLDEIQRKGSPAHVKEVLNRAKYWGWDDPEIWDIHNIEE